MPSPAQSKTSRTLYALLAVYIMASMTYYVANIAGSIDNYFDLHLATYNIETRESMYVNAGHNPPFLIRRKENNFRAERLEAGGPVVGLLPSAMYQEQCLVLEPGDLLLAYTDGVSEAMAEHEEEWGEERMLASALTLPDGTAQQVLEHLFAEADRFTGNAAQFDDMTLLVLNLEKAQAAADSHLSSHSG